MSDFRQYSKFENFNIKLEVLGHGEEKKFFWQKSSKMCPKNEQKARSFAIMMEYLEK